MHTLGSFLQTRLTGRNNRTAEPPGRPAVCKLATPTEGHDMENSVSQARWLLLPVFGISGAMMFLAVIAA